VPLSDSDYPEILFRGLDANEKEEFKRLLAHAKLIERVVEIIKGWKTEIDTTPRDDYESPAWACKQADRNGAGRTLLKVLTLLDHKE
jgi:hypothetical protein